MAAHGGASKGGKASPAALGRGDYQEELRSNFKRWAGKRMPYPKSNMPPAKVIFKKSS
jgi:hypothetical protein